MVPSAVRDYWSYTIKVGLWGRSPARFSEWLGMQTITNQAWISMENGYPTSLKNKDKGSSFVHAQLNKSKTLTIPPSPPHRRAHKRYPYVGCTTRCQVVHMVVAADSCMYVWNVRRSIHVWLIVMLTAHLGKVVKAPAQIFAATRYLPPSAWMELYGKLTSWKIVMAISFCKVLLRDFVSLILHLCHPLCTAQVTHLHRLTEKRGCVQTKWYWNQKGKWYHCGQKETQLSSP